MELTEKSSLHIGLLTLDRRQLISPHSERPDLFTVPLEEGARLSCEKQARSALAQLGIRASQDRSLVSTGEAENRGYVLRESTRVNISEHGFMVFDRDEVEEYAENEDPRGINAVFLQQIAKHMHHGTRR